MTVQERNLLSRFIKKFQTIFFNYNYEEKDLEENLIKNNICNEEAIETIDKTFDSIVEDDDKHDLIYKDYSEIKAISDSQKINVEEVASEIVEEVKEVKEVSKPIDKNTLKGHLKLLSDIIDNKFTSEENDEFVKNNPSLEFICNFSRQKSYEAYKEEHVKNGGIDEFYTPFYIVDKQISKLIESCPGINTKNIATLNIEYIVVLVNKYNILEENISFITDSKIKTQFIKDFFPKVDILEYNKLTDFYDEENKKLSVFLKEKKNMKFDIVIGNPPYQSSTCGESSGAFNTLWDKFVFKCYAILEDTGYGALCFVHPSAWRGNGNHKKVGDLFRKNNLKYLAIHNIQDGISTFNASTRYDWYLLNKNENYVSTEIWGEDKKKYTVNIKKYDFIPNFDIDFIYSLLAKDNDEKVKMVYSGSAYHASRHNHNKTISETKSDIFKYPCIKYVSKRGVLDLMYSHHNKEHFGIPKVTFGIGAQVGGIFIDYSGEYGLCEFVAGISCSTKEELENVHKALNSDKFKEVMKAVQFTTQMYNKNIISMFRKDFWKEFI